MEWFEVKDIHKIDSPSLLVYPERVRRNVESMLKIAGGPERLYPHIKTHKTKEVIEICQDYGVESFKCATLKEAELLGQCGVKEVVYSMPLQMQMLKRFNELTSTYPSTTFSALVDHEVVFGQLSSEAARSNLKIPLWLDINTGMNRTGIEPNEAALELYIKMSKDPFIIAKGIHAYDGHIHQANYEERRDACNIAFEPVSDLIESITSKGLKVPRVIAGGSPTFEIHADRKDVYLSPGTPVFWDAGYSQLFEEMPFDHAAVLITRIISKPGEQLLCFDLGHKMLASEMSFPRIHFLQNNQFEQISQSEEHLVVRFTGPDIYEPGQVFYVVPKHICPTVSKYAKLISINDNEVTGEWIVRARDH